MHQRREGRHRRPTTAGPGRALLTVALALSLGTLLNAQALLETARSLELGAKRDAMVALMEPVADLSRALRLDVPRRSLDEALGRREPDAPAPSASPSPLPSASPSATPSPSSSPAGPRVPTTQDPLRIRVIGDSMAQAPGQSLITFAADLDVATAALDFRFSSGLSRPDFFDWPGHLAAALSGSRPPEAVVVFFGANDAQGMETSHGVLTYGTAAWDTEYAARVAAVMRQLTDAGVRVYWVGQPVARPAGYSQRMAHLDEIYRAQAQRHRGVRYVDSWSLFTDADGHYSAYLPTGSGTTLMRLGDGIHLTRAGGDRLARAILDALRLDWRLP
jgi:hypothetical protein